MVFFHNFPYHHTPRDIIEVAEKQNEKQFLITHSFASGKEEGRGKSSQGAQGTIESVRGGDTKGRGTREGRAKKEGSGKGEKKKREGEREIERVTDGRMVVWEWLTGQDKTG